MTLPFLDSKIQIPVCSSSLVPRLRLIENLNRCLLPGIQITLVSAPAGFGKTTLLTQWINTIPKTFQIAWLSLEPMDNDLSRFFSCLTTSIQKTIPGIAKGLAALIEVASTFNADQFVSYLCNQLTEYEENLILIIDDYHVIKSSEIHSALMSFINHLPANIRIVIAGRVEPSIPLARYRARGTLVEIGAGDLRFNPEESDAFLAGYPAVYEALQSEALISRITETTEGWASGLQLTIMALTSEVNSRNASLESIVTQFVNQLSGSHRYIIDYLLEEVLRFESVQIREFLYYTCILERFNADLCLKVCNQLTSLHEVQEILEYLERAHLFIVPLDNQREWFRYHHLFADVLKKQLFHYYPELPGELHYQAATWFEEKGMVDEALTHALLSGNSTLPVAIVEKHALETIMQGNISTAQRWLDILGQDVLFGSPRLCLDQSWALIFTGRTEKAQAYLTQVENLIANQPPDGLSIKSEIFSLQCFCETTYGHAEKAIQLAHLAIDSTPTDSAFLNCCNHLFLASALAYAGKLDEAQREYRAIQPFCQMSHKHVSLALVEAGFLQHLAMVLNARGSVTQAKSILRQAIQTFEEKDSGKEKAAALPLYDALGKILFIENNLIESEMILEKGLLLDPASLSVASFDSWLALWWVKTGQLDYQASRDILNHIQEIAQGRDEIILRIVVFTNALQNLLEEKVQQAAAFMEKLGFSENPVEALEKVSDSELMGWRSNEFFTYARLLSMQHNAPASLQVLEHMERVANSFGLDWIKYRTLIVQAVVHHQTGQTEHALQIMANLLEQTENMELNPARIYLAAGEPARSLLQEALKHGLYPAHCTTLLAEFPVLAAIPSAPHLPESLTNRELEVLHLMADGLKNQEIAETLVVSLNTIRYHSKNIFGKLNVSTRTAAVARARHIGVLTQKS